MAYNPFDYIKQVDDEEAKDIVAKLRKEGKNIRIRKDDYMCYGDDWEEWKEYLVKIEIMESKNNSPLPSLPAFTYKCHYTLNEQDAKAFCDELRKI